MIFLNVYTKAILDRKLSWPTFAISVASYILLVSGIYQSFAGNPAFAKILDQYPKAVLSLLAGGGGGPSMMSPAGFISVEFLQLWGMIIIAGFAISAATAIVAKEVDGHTMDLILTQPIDRVEYLTARLAADMTMIAGLVIVVIVSLWASTKLFVFPLKTEGILAVGVLCLALFLMIECFSLLLGVFMERGRAVIVSVALLIVSHLVNGLADLNKTLDSFRWLSFFNYYKPGQTLVDGAVPWPQILLFAALGLIFFITAIVLFREKDIPS
jgi:ABC-2 type transport system permease protein